LNFEEENKIKNSLSKYNASNQNNYKHNNNIYSNSFQVKEKIWKKNSESASFEELSDSFFEDNNANSIEVSSNIL
jgi:hypothetical protein